MARKRLSPQEKQFKEAINVALHRRSPSDGKKMIYKIANKLVALAARGDLTAIKEVIDRTDGKPPSYKEVDVNVHSDPITVLLEEVAAQGSRLIDITPTPTPVERKRARSKGQKLIEYDKENDDE